MQSACTIPKQGIALKIAECNRQLSALERNRGSNDAERIATSHAIRHLEIEIGELWRQWAAAVGKGANGE